jgi:hypothetical protein
VDAGHACHVDDLRLQGVHQRIVVARRHVNLPLPCQFRSSHFPWISSTYLDAGPADARAIQELVLDGGGRGKLGTVLAVGAEDLLEALLVLRRLNAELGHLSHGLAEDRGRAYEKTPRHDSEGQLIRRRWMRTIPTL